MTDLAVSRFGSSLSSSRSTANADEVAFDEGTRSLRRREARIFPIFSEMAQAMNVSFEIYFLFHSFAILRFFLCSLWPSFDTIWDGERTGLINIIDIIVTFGFTHITASSQNIFALIFILLAISILFWHFLVLKYYQTTHFFPKWQLSVTRVIHQCLIPVVLPIYATMIGWYSKSAMLGSFTADGVDTIDSLLLAFTLLSGVFLSTVFYFAYGFACFSPILMYQAVVCSWDPFPFTAMVAVQCWCQFWGLFMPVFAPWVYCVFLLLCLVAVVYAMLSIRALPFQRFSVNIVFVCAMSASCLIQVCLVPVFLGYSVSPAVFIPVPLALSAVAGAAAHRLLTRERRAIAGRLSYSAIECAGERPSDAEKKAYFEAQNLSKEHRILTWIRVGLAERCDLFLDFSLLHYVFETSRSHQLTIAATLVLSFFPTELQFFGSCLAVVQTFPRPNLFDHFMMYQMRKVFVMRQSSLSKEASSQIRHLRHEARDARSAIRAVWVDAVKAPKHIAFGGLSEIQTLLHRLRGNFYDLTDRYANNQDLCHEFASFLIEAAGEFMEAFRWKARAQLIEAGVRLDVDFAFRSLMNRYPRLLLDHIFTDRGEYLRGPADEAGGGNESQNSGASALTLGSTDSSTANMPDNELEELGQTVIHEMRLRTAIETSVSRMNLRGFTVLRTAIILVHCFACLIGVVFLAISPSISSNLNIVFDLLNNMTAFDISYSKSLMAGGLLLANDTWYTAFGGVPQLETFTGLRDLKGFTIVNDLKLKTWTLSRTARKTFLAVMTALLLVREEHPEAVLWMSNAESVVSYAVVPAVHNMTGRASLFEALDRLGIGATWTMTDEYMNEEWEPHYKGWISMFEGMVDLSVNINWINLQRVELMRDSNLFIEAYVVLFIAFQYVLPIVIGVVFLIAVLFGLIQFYSAFGEALRVIRGVRPEAVERSLYPISKSVRRERMNNGSTQLAKSGGWLYHGLPIAIFVGIIINCVLVTTTFTSAVTELEESKWILSWYNLAEERITSSAELIGLIAATAGISGSEDGPITLSTPQIPIETVEELLSQFDRSRTQLLIGDEENGIPPPIGFNQDLDSQELMDSCDGRPNDFRDFMNCMSTDRSCSELSILARKILQVYQHDKVCYPLSPYCSRLQAHETDFSQMVVISDGSLNSQLSGYITLLLQYAKESFSAVTNTFVLFGLIIILVNIVFTIVMSIALVRLSQGIDSIKLLLKLLPPRDVLSDMRFAVLIAGEDAIASRKVMTPAEIGMNRSSEAIIAISLDYTIEIANNAFLEIAGLSADEVIGQRLAMVFPPSEDNSPDSPSHLYALLEGLKNGVPEDIPILTVRCTTETELQIAVEIMTLAHTDADGQVISVSLLMQDLSKQAAGELKSIEIKERCESIVKAMMPMEVYAGFNSDNHATMFTSMSGTVISVEITGFLENVTSYSPSQMLEAISAVYDLFEEITSLHSSVHTANYGPNDILACCGLFDYADHPDEQVEHAALTCLEFASHREDISEKLAIEMDIRSGISFGGIVIGDVLSSDAPGFDLIGAVVTEAVAIRNTTPPGEVRVSASVQRLLKPDKFTAKEVMIRGKRSSGMFEIGLHNPL